MKNLSPVSDERSALSEHPIRPASVECMHWQEQSLQSILKVGAFSLAPEPLCRVFLPFSCIPPEKTVAFLLSMEDPNEEPESLIPEHLRPFTRPSLTTEPHSYRRPTTASSRQPVELCPPHWRLEPRRSLSELMQDILLKDWKGANRHTSPRATMSERPSTMRMKDSEDYITARAANPRTGLISPSIGGSTPKPVWTRGTLGEALKLEVEAQPHSPTPEPKSRPSLKRSDDGRKPGAGSSPDWRAGGNGRVTGIVVASASPRVAYIKADAAPIKSKAQTVLSDDQFVVRMPSAGEPQPYAYPGYSSRQIQAFEHCRNKARRESYEGYGQRLVHYQQTSGGVRDILTYEKTALPERLSRKPVESVGNTRVYKRGRNAFEPDEAFPNVIHYPEPVSTAATFSPYCPPRPPRMSERGMHPVNMKC